MSPLKNIMEELQLRRVHIYARWVTSFLIDVRTVHLPVFSSLSFSSVFGSRFHEGVKNTLETCKADVIEFYQHLTEPMEAIHRAIV
jgi:DNA excision repair protein ERCC-4